MTELLIIKTAEAEKIKSLLTREKLDYQVIYNEVVQERELTPFEFKKQLEKDYKAWANDPEE
jgi:hypothetical protein